MDRALGRLKACGEERFDLFVGLVNRAGPANLFIALAAEF